MEPGLSSTALFQDMQQQSPDRLATLLIGKTRKLGKITLLIIYLLEIDLYGILIFKLIKVSEII